MKDQAREAVLTLFGLLERLSRGANPFGSGSSGRRSRAQALVDREDIAKLRGEVRHRLIVAREELERILTERECYLALFPIVVCVDEMVQTRYANVDQTVWPLLQREFFQVDQGGELFYTTIDEGLEVSRFAPIIYEIFYFCLAVGFGGKHSGNDAQLSAYMRKLAAKLELPPEGLESAPMDATASGAIRPTRSHWWYYLAAGVFVVAIYALLSALADDPPQDPIEDKVAAAAVTFSAWPSAVAKAVSTESSEQIEPLVYEEEQTVAKMEGDEEQDDELDEEELDEEELAELDELAEEPDEAEYAEDIEGDEEDLVADAEDSDGHAGDQRSDDDLLVRRRPVVSDRAADQPLPRQHAGGEHHGQQAGRQHPTVRDVQHAVQSGRRCSNGCEAGRLHPGGLRAGDPGAVADRKSHRPARKHALFDERQQADVHLGRSDSDYPPWAVHRSELELAQEMVCVAKAGRQAMGTPR